MEQLLHPVHFPLIAFCFFNGYDYFLSVIHPCPPVLLSSPPNQAHPADPVVRPQPSITASGKDYSENILAVFICSPVNYPRPYLQQAFPPV
jgi:hypothetical protein